MRLGVARHCLAAVMCAVAAGVAGDVEAVAFPGAEGHGASSVGGRGGRVVFVTSLADSGPGTLRDALAKPWPRNVIFRVGGTITLQSPLEIKSPYVTVAGQTAPGGGIQLRNDPVAPYGLHTDSFVSLVIATHDVVIRYLRIRPGLLQPNPACTGKNAVRHPEGLPTCVDANDIRAIEVAPGARRIMLDHLSIAWGVDKLLAVIGASDVSLQWSILAEGINYVLYERFFSSRATGGGHGTITGNDASAEAGLLTGRLSFHHNLFALLLDRAPQMNPNCPSSANPLACASDVVNNYVYDWEEYGAHASNFKGHSYVNMVGNYFRGGRDTKNVQKALLLTDWGRSRDALVPDAQLGVHVSGNQRWRAEGVNETAAPSCGRWNAATARWGPCLASTYRASRFATPPITTTAAVTAHDQVLGSAGASYRLDQSGLFRMARDAADQRVVTDARRGTGRTISSYAEFPGWPTLLNGAEPYDADRDGMPNAWEDRYPCVDATRSDHALDADSDGYTHLEEYLNGTPPCRSGGSGVPSFDIF